MFQVWKISVLGLVLTGCNAVGPDYVKPVADTPGQFVRGGTASLTDASTQAWWQGLNDPILTKYLTRGAAQNLEIKTALARMREAETGLRRTGVNSQISGSASASAERSDNGFSTDNRSSGSFDAAFVFDLFGGVRRDVERADAAFDAARFDVGTVRLAFISEITNFYVQARQAQAAAAVTRETIASRKKTLELVNERRGVGETTELDVAQAESLLNSARADLPAQQANFEANVFAIATLLAEPAAPLMQEMRPRKRQPVPSGHAAQGVPADLLRNRPDIRFAERNLAAATAAIGVAEAELYPQLTLSGLITTGDLLGSNSDEWRFGPFISVPVLNRGLLKANRDAAIARARQAELEWRQSVLSAVEEVQAALSRVSYLSQQIVSERAAIKSAERVLDLSRELYKVGEITLTDVLDAERVIFIERLRLAAMVRDHALAWAQLQVASGKGWQSPSLVLEEKEIELAALGEEAKAGSPETSN